MVIGLLTPILGPVIYHHYFDVSPAHAHLFVGDETNLHVHPVTFDDHPPGEESGDGISIASTSASSAQNPLTLDGASLELSIPDFVQDIIALHIGESEILNETAISPLDRPPRRA